MSFTTKKISEDVIRDNIGEHIDTSKTPTRLQVAPETEKDVHFHKLNINTREVDRLLDFSGKDRIKVYGKDFGMSELLRSCRFPVGGPEKFPDVTGFIMQSNIQPKHHAHHLRDQHEMWGVRDLGSSLYGKLELTDIRNQKLTMGEEAEFQEVVRNRDKHEEFADEFISRQKLPMTGKSIGVSRNVDSDDDLHDPPIYQPPEGSLAVKPQLLTPSLVRGSSADKPTPPVTPIRKRVPSPSSPVQPTQLLTPSLVRSSSADKPTPIATSSQTHGSSSSSAIPVKPVTSAELSRMELPTSKKIAAAIQEMREAELRKQNAEKEQLEQQQAATKIQSVQRMSSAVKQKVKQQQAATKVQSAVRMLSAKRHLEALKAEVAVPVSVAEPPRKILPKTIKGYLELYSTINNNDIVGIGHLTTINGLLPRQFKLSGKGSQTVAKVLEALTKGQEFYADKPELVARMAREREKREQQKLRRVERLKKENLAKLEKAEKEQEKLEKLEKVKSPKSSKPK
jgi:hypothetical protein